jgi:hypothetical protein
LQCFSLLAIFSYLQVKAWRGGAPEYLIWIRDLSIYAMLVSTVLSGLQYLWRAFLLLKEP